MKKSQIDLSLYLVTEESIAIEELTRIIAESVSGGVSIVQLREKNNSSLSFYKKASALKQLLNGLSIPLVINDRVDIALAVGADGIHIGQDDLPLPVVKKMVPEDMIVGVSVSTLEEALEAERNGADYIGVGSVFPTKTKKDATLMALEDLGEICRGVSIPAVAIGGITADNMSALSNSGLSGTAVVSAIMNADNPKTASESLLKIIKDFK
ncbi:thiamine phosphate synthase [Peribacillus frigoritolerans]|uniref:thiamine phosphate synthase n=1 Tax=Peribacillus frigoritolerans TaxID=450367 RepID=UPI0006AC6650|nr:thiamine phosphate synthase [Peribacillus frigoritolerans]KOR77928.1 thiamine-phosphate pyrophosphorylase [Bacillus sp. FJAT-21352]MCY9140101.1 thiamine phosphate synthase [Peribacillus frigoritolerans]MED4688508.1 thiamine phosphate synthase [Peribacillus frigoritolerans]USK81648.1 thiamine phosphate synthase [Peribacillus frigoritolerans]WJE48939.1 thiamine phosphate synthase [Peribacillus frigoritolerans]